MTAGLPTLPHSVQPPARPPRGARWIAAGVAGHLLLVAAAIGVTELRLRDALRTQIARRDATLLAGLLRQQLRESGDESASDPLTAILETTRLPQLPGVRSVILYSPTGRFVHGWPLTVASVPLENDLRLEAAAGTAGARFFDRRAISDEFLSASASDAAAAPMLEVVVAVPDSLHNGVAGFARFLLDGDGMAQEFATLDATLRRQAAWTFSLAGIATAGVVGWALRQLSQSNRRLRQANLELTLAAKTSAMGAVASHLIHGLKNPLTGLQTLLRDPAFAGDSGSGVHDAATLTRRMRGMIDDVARVLREDSGFADYEVEAADLFTVLQQRLGPEAAARNQGIEFHPQGTLLLPNRDANLTLLILENLSHNALQASPSGSALRLGLSTTLDAAVFSVTDSGPGLPPEIQERLFSPVISTKPGGSGIGLALSRQLARHMGADLRLERTGPDGSVFTLRLPLPRSAS